MTARPIGPVLAGAGVRMRPWWAGARPGLADDADRVFGARLAGRARGV